MSLTLRSRLLPFALLAAMTATVPASAQSDDVLCARLEGELARIESGGSGNQAEYQRWDNAVRNQEAQIAEASRDARDYGCFGGGFRASPVCGQIMAALTSMEDNLASLRGRRDRNAGDRADPVRIAQIRADIDALGCSRRLQDAGVPTGAEREPTLHSNRRPDGEGRRIPDSDWRRQVDGILRPEAPGGPRFEASATYRTMCVRSCDGYYFPVSFSTTPDGFAGDAERCANHCPAGNATLFVHRNPGESVDDMVSLDGRSYTDMETAFAYREGLSEGCSCQPGNVAASEEEANPRGLAALTPPAGGGLTPLPSRKPDVASSDPAAEPEAPAPGVERQAPQPAQALQPAEDDVQTGSEEPDGDAPQTAGRDAASEDAPAARERRPLAEDDRPVRQVGPAFPYDQ